MGRPSVPSPECRREFVEKLMWGYDETNSQAERIASCEWLAGWVPDPIRARAFLAETYRKGSAGVRNTVVLHQVLQHSHFSIPELANRVPCCRSRICKAVKDTGMREVISPTVLSEVIRHSAFPTDGLAPYPTDRQCEIAGRCHAAPKFLEFLERQFSCPKTVQRKSVHEPLAFHTGLVMDALVVHPEMRHILDVLPVIQPNATELRRQSALMDVLEDCVAQGNVILNGYPRLAELVGSVRLDPMLDDIGSAFLYFESCFLCRELFIDSVNDTGDMLGIFI